MDEHGLDRMVTKLMNGALVHDGPWWVVSSERMVLWNRWGFWVVSMCCEPHSAKQAKPLRFLGDYIPPEGQRGSRLLNDGQESSLINKMNNGADY